jgi:surface protein
MFKYCEGLKTVGKLDNWNTSNVLYMSNLFYLDENLEDVGDLSNWDVSEVRRMDSMFEGTTKLKSIGDISGWNTSNVSSMTAVFKNSGINDLNVDNWDTSNVLIISSMFFNCATPEFNLSNWNLSRCISMSYMFGRPSGNQGYNPIRKVGNIGRWNTSKVTTINSMFQFARDLEKLDLSGWDMSKCTNMSRAFCGLYQWTGPLVLHWSTTQLGDLRETFEDTYNLTEINISTWNFSKVYDIYRCFSTSPNYWYNTTEDTYPDGTRRMKLVNLYLGSFDMSSVNLTRYGNRSDYQVFIGCANLKHIFLNADSTSGFEFLKTQLVYDTDYSGGPTIASHCKIHKGSDVYSYNGSTWVKQ